MKSLFQYILICSALLLSANVFAQDLDDLLDQMEAKEKEEVIEYTSSTFKGTKVINLHSVERLAPGALEFRIAHRFGRLNGGWRELWGIDQASIRFGLDYGINDHLTLGFGRTTYEKTYDFYGKAALLRQSTGKRNMPISLVWFSSMAINTLDLNINPERQYDFKHRLAYVHQLIIGRKFSPGFSMEIVPSLVMHNLVEKADDANIIPALGFAGRMKLSKRVSLNAEYIYRLPQDNTPNIDNYYDSFSVGFDIETGGHIFQLHFTNSSPMIEKGFITETNGNWADGDIQFGFNITREFTVKGKH